MRLVRRALQCFIGAQVLIGAANVCARLPVSVDRVWVEKIGPAVTATDVLNVTDLGAVAASPDGRRVAFVSRNADVECNCHRQTLHLLDRNDGAIKEVMNIGEPFVSIRQNGAFNGGMITAQPIWSDDGKQLAFVANREGKAVLMVCDESGANLRTVLRPAEQVFAFAWGRNSNTLIYLTGGPDSEVVTAIQQSYKNGFLYGPQFLGVPAGQLPRAPIVPMPPPYEFKERAVPHAPYGQLVAVSMSTWASHPADSSEQETFLHGLISSITHSVIDRRPDLRLSAGRPCGSRPAGMYWITAQHEFILACTSPAEESWTQGYAEFFQVNYSSGRSRKKFELLAPGIFDGALGQPCDLSDEEMICVEEEPSSPPRLIAVNFRGKRRILFDPNGSLRHRHFGRVEQLGWKNETGMETWGYLVYPSAYSPGKRYPLVIVQYNASGFLRGGTGNEYPIFPFAESGFFVLNFRHPSPAPEDPNLSPEERKAAQWKDSKWRRSVQSSLDIVIQSVIDRGLVDFDRIAYTGLSGGANQLDYAISNGRRMAAAISSTCCVGPENWPATAANLLYSSALKITGWSNPATDADYAKTWMSVSPSLNVEKIHTAFLANMSQDEMLAANALWVKMRADHRPMEIYIYAGEHHIKNQPVHRAAIYRRNIEWLRFWLQGYEDPSSHQREQYLRWRKMREEWGVNDPSSNYHRGVESTSSFN